MEFDLGVCAKYRRPRTVYVTADAMNGIDNYVHLERRELVATAQRSGIEAARPGANLADVDAAARDLIRAAGHGEHFGHGLGHGVGLEVHEAPMLGYGRTGKLADRVPVTVEPGIYLPGRGGVRIEDVLVVGAEGTGLLTTTTRELLVL